MENALLASELAKSYHKSTVSPSSAIQIDISKAFDTVQRSFLPSTLAVLGIPENFIYGLKNVFLASFSMKVNGELAEYFNSKRGIRLGCSLSPYVFVICMQVLSKMLNKGAAEKRFGYHPYCQGLKLTHLSFADDLLVFTDGKRQSIEGIINILTSLLRCRGCILACKRQQSFLLV